MGLEIENLARESFLAAETKAGGGRSWERLCIEERRAWLANAVIRWPDVDAGVRVAPDHWAAGVLPVACENRNCFQPRGHEGPHFAPIAAGEVG